MAIIADGEAQILSTTRDIYNHDQRYYVNVVRDTLFIRRDIFNDVTAYYNQIVSAWNNLMASKKTDLPEEEDEAFLADVYSYTDEHLPEEVDATARTKAEERYSKALEEISASAFDGLWSRFATKELQNKYRDIILTRIVSAEVKKLEGFSEETREAGMEDLFQKYWQSEKAKEQKRKSKILEAFRAEVSTAFVESHDEYIHTQALSFRDSLRRDPMVWRSFKPIIENLIACTKRFKEIYNSSSTSSGSQAEAYFRNEWTDYLKTYFPHYYAVTGGVKVKELTREVQVVNPYYDPDFETRVKPWRWVDDLAQQPYQLQDDYRIYPGHEEYKVKAIEGTNALAVYSDNRLVAVSKGFEDFLSTQAYFYEVLGADLNNGSIQFGNVSEEQLQQLHFSFRNHLTYRGEKMDVINIQDIVSSHNNDLDNYIIERSGGLEFLYHVRGNTAALRETYFEDANGNIFRRLKLVIYDPEWKP